MSKVMLDVVKTDLDGGNSYQCAVYNNERHDPNEAQHAKFSYIAEALDWVTEMTLHYERLGLEVTASLSARSVDTSGPIKKCEERWATMYKLGDTEHPVDTEWRSTLGDVHPDKHTPNETL